jgi:FMN reductase (NADPH)
MTQTALATLLGHRTIRSFKTDPIEKEKLDLILKAGTRSATPAEMQFYSLILVDDPETLARLNLSSPMAVVACIDLHRHNRWMASWNAAPLQGGVSDLLFCFWDVALTLQNMAIAAESLGLGTLTVVREMEDLFDLPEGVYPAGILGLGYASEDPPLRQRFPLEAVIHHAKYRVPTDEQLREWYESLDAKWNTIPRPRLEALGDKSCTNFAQVLSALLKRETGWIESNLQSTGYRAACGDT